VPDEISPEHVRKDRSYTWEKQSYLHASYADQQIAVLGIVVTTRGRTPFQNPLKPSRRSISRQPSTKPLTFRNSESVAVPLVCNIVFTTSIGVVRAAANPPATAPAEQCVIGSYFLVGLIAVEIDSYARNCRAVNGTVIESVVGYDT
jgi:hypothetical protein